jgi:hypothetical protein
MVVKKKKNQNPDGSSKCIVKSLGEPSNAGLSDELWASIWKLREPAVLRTFVWKVCSDVLPTKEKLARRHISEDPLCPICC